MFFLIPMIINKITDTAGDSNGIYFFLAGPAIYFCKDCINGRSIAKRILKQQVVDNVTGTAASPLKCLVRNLFMVIWPVEVVMLLINPSRRPGDKVPGKSVVSIDPEIEQARVNYLSVLVSLALSYGILLLANIYLLSRYDYPRHPVEASYNATESKSLEKLFADSMGTKLSADVKIYDSIQHHNVKFIKIIYSLKQEYFANLFLKQSLKHQTMKLIYSLFPEWSFTGVATYIYRTAKSYRSGREDIGRKI